jgi:hypothetical protein
MKAIKKRDVRIISILENYLKDEKEQDKEEQNKKEQNENISDDELEDELNNSDENHSFILNNPNKQTKPKGCPKGTKRIKAHHEKESSSVISKQYKCSNCGDMGHNKQNCSRL